MTQPRMVPSPTCINCGDPAHDRRAVAACGATGLVADFCLPCLMRGVARVEIAPVRWVSRLIRVAQGEAEAEKSARAHFDGLPSPKLPRVEM